MGYEEDRVKEEPVSVFVGDREFKVKPMNGRETDALMDKCVKGIGSDGKSASIEIGVKNEELLKTVVDAPYDLKGKPFKELTLLQKLDVLQSLKIRNALLVKIDELNNIDGEDKKK